MKIFILSIFSLLFSNSFSQVSTWTWGRNAQGVSYDGAQSVATDSDGNVYVTGYFYGSTINFGSFVLNNTNPNESDMFIVKYDPSGTVLWAQSAGEAEDDGGYSITIDASDNVYVTGYFVSSLIAFGPFTLFNLGSYDMFVVKYDSSGAILWAQSAGENGDDYGRSVITDNLNNVYVAGSFQSLNLNFGSVTLTNADSSALTHDMYVVKYDSAGTFQWAISAGGIDEEYTRALDYDGFGNLYLTGNFNSVTLPLGSTTLTNSGFYDMFLVKINSSANFIWARSGGGNDIDYGNSVAVDGAGNIYVSGGFASPVINFGSVPLINSGIFNMYLVKYDSGGNLVWSKKSGGSGTDDGYDVTTDVSGNIFVTGYFTSPSLIFGPSTLTNSGLADVFIVKYNSSGSEIWAKSAGDLNDDLGIAVTSYAADVYIAGYFRSTTINFASMLNNTGGDDSFIAKIGETGTGITDENVSNKFTFNPTIFSNQSTIVFTDYISNAEIIISDAVGKIWRTIKFSGKEYTFEKGSLKPGPYFIKITTLDFHQPGIRFIIQ